MSKFQILKYIYFGIGVALLLLVAACGGSSGGSKAPAVVELQQYSAKIKRTEDNVPHIVADDEASLAFGLGYVGAEDHICKVADGVLWGRSEFSRFHGAGVDDVNINRDLVYKSLGIYGRSVKQVDAASDEAKEWLKGYVAGYNHYLKETGVAGITGWCRGGDWVRPIDEYDLAAFHATLGTLPSTGSFISPIAGATPPGQEIVASAKVSRLVKADMLVLAELPTDNGDGSNSWAIGVERAENGVGMLMGNSHLSWVDRLHYHEVHLQVPGKIDAYGSVLAGYPGLIHGFNKHAAWSVTISNGNRFTAYTLDLVDGNPTAYHYDDEIREMTSELVVIEVLNESGGLDVIERTMWSSHYGPIINFPGVGWSDSLTLTMRDANAGLSVGNRLFHKLAVAEDIDDIIAAHKNEGGMIAFNTIAADSGGRTWFGDTAATPNLSQDALDAWRERLDSDIFTQIAYSNRVVLLHGSNSRDEWVNTPDGMRPGLMAFEDLPQLERADFVFNANDSYRWTNQAELIDENRYSPLSGSNERVSARTRMNARMLSAGPEGGAGDDGKFSFEEIKQAALANRVFTAEILLDQLVERCNAVTEIDLNGELVSLEEACDILAAWDRKVDLDSSGAILWREFIHSPEERSLYLDERDPADYVNTPSILVTGDEPLLRLAGAIKTLENAGVSLDVPVGEVQFAYRGDVKVPLHGGGPRTGVTNSMSSRPSSHTSEPSTQRGDLVPGSKTLRTDGYPISGGTTFLFAVELLPEGPNASAFLVYGGDDDVSSSRYISATTRFSEKNWRTIAFTDKDVSDSAIDEYTVEGVGQ
jgi:acyl-homoserine-lactone acylase